MTRYRTLIKNMYKDKKKHPNYVLATSMSSNQSTFNKSISTGSIHSYASQFKKFIDKAYKPIYNKDILQLSDFPELPLDEKRALIEKYFESLTGLVKNNIYKNVILLTFKWGFPAKTTDELTILRNEILINFNKQEYKEQSVKSVKNKYPCSMNDLRKLIKYAKSLEDKTMLFFIHWTYVTGLRAEETTRVTYKKIRITDTDGISVLMDLETKKRNSPFELMLSPYFFEQWQNYLSPSEEHANDSIFWGIDKKHPSTTSLQGGFNKLKKKCQQSGIKFFNIESLTLHSIRRRGARDLYILDDDRERLPKIYLNHNKKSLSTDKYIRPSISKIDDDKVELLKYKKDFKKNISNLWDHSVMNILYLTLYN